MICFSQQDSYSRHSCNDVSFVKVLSLEGWSVEQMYFYLDSVGYPVTVTFYLTLILIGALFAINLLTAILSAKVLVLDC